VNNIRIALALFALLVFSGTGAAESDPASSVDEAGKTAINCSSSAITLEVYPTPGIASGIDEVTFTYKVNNLGTTKLCSITINNSLSVVPLDPFDLEPGENATLTAEYHITPEDRESPFLENEVDATGHSCKNGRATTTALAACAVLLS